jgi:SAM-dependent methyltransferase
MSAMFFLRQGVAHPQIPESAFFTLQNKVKCGSSGFMRNFIRTKLEARVQSRLRKRAVRLLDWIRFDARNLQGPHLDLGCGTGHNADAMRRRGLTPVVECDVVDYHMLGGEVDLFDGRTLPYASNQFKNASLLYALHYAEEPGGILKELKRTVSGRLILVQSTYDHALGRRVLNLREFFLGRLPFRLLRRCGVLPDVPCGMATFRHVSRTELQDLLQHAGLTVRDHGRTRWPGLGVNREWFVLIPEEGGE